MLQSFLLPNITFYSLNGTSMCTAVQTQKLLKGFHLSVIKKAEIIKKKVIKRRSGVCSRHSYVFVSNRQRGVFWLLFKKAPVESSMEKRRKWRMRAAVTVRPLPVVTSRDRGGFKRRRLLLLLLHPLLGQREDTCERLPEKLHVQTENNHEGRGTV